VTRQRQVARTVRFSSCGDELLAGERLLGETL
jgi:hypothetical protein